MKNKIKIKLFGLNLSKIVNHLISKNIIVFDLVSKGKYSTFYIYEKDFLIFDECCKFYKKEYIILERKNLKSFLTKIPCFFGVFFALILIACYIFSYNFILFDIKVVNETNLYYDTEKVKNILKDNNINFGTNIKRLNSNEIEKIILGDLDNLSGCSVLLNGGCLEIKIIPEIKIENKKQKQIFSKYDAVLTDVKIFSGNSTLKVGDVVKMGDLLIDSNGESMGEFKGNVYFSSTKVYNKINQSKKFTGRYFVNKEYFIFNKSLFKRHNINHFSKYLTKKCDFYVMENYFLPIKCVSEYYFEYEIEEYVVEFEEVESELKKQLYDEVCGNIPNDTEIINVYYSVVEEGNLTRVDCFVEVNMSII